MFASDSIEGNSVEIIVRGWFIVQFLSILGRRGMVHVIIIIIIITNNVTLSRNGDNYNVITSVWVEELESLQNNSWIELSSAYSTVSGLPRR